MGRGCLGPQTGATHHHAQYDFQTKVLQSKSWLSDGCYLTMAVLEYRIPLKVNAALASLDDTLKSKEKLEMMPSLFDLITFCNLALKGRKGILDSKSYKYPKF